ncbi:hypothetical protein ACGFIF_17805 [Kribbella sp. NPDC049174]|uniref:hypothetical protein n=1 Tax=Kribbella sp. NPDC049174 TaxID=3364112 RepID=UPI00370FA4DE
MRFSVRVGAEVLPGTPEYEWVSSVVAAVERRTGRTSRWDRRLYEGPSDQSGGKAVANGPLILARKNVLDPVVRAYTAQAPLTPDEIVAARQAVYVTVHEAVHHLSDAGDEEAPDAVWHGSPAEIALEEGLADTEAVRIEMDIIRDIGMDRAVPRILDLHISAAEYSAYNQAVDDVVHGLAELTEQHPDDVRAVIHRTPMAQRYAAMADLVIDHRLGDLTEHRAELRARLAEPLRSGLGALPRYEGHDRPAEMSPQQAADIGAQHAQRAVREVGRRLPQLRSQYAAVADMQRFLGEHTGHSTAAGAGAGAGGAAAGAGAAASGAAAAAAVVLPFRRELGRAVE